MAHRLDVLDLHNTGPTDGVEDDTLWVADLREADGRREQFRFSLAARYGVPTDNEMRDMIRRYAGGLSIAELHERAEPHGEDPYRRVIFLRP